MKAIGIDLGTTNSVAAFVEENGELRILPSREGDEQTPSIVSFSTEGILIGKPARNNAKVAPADTIFSVKRLMGRAFDNPQVEKVRKTYPYIVTSADDREDRTVRVVINGVKYKPEQISEMILRKIVGDSSKVLNEEVTHAVITVPAYFVESQREATRKAGETAGLVVKKIIDEPTAAAIAFGIDQCEQNHRVLVFDMGGGTLDVSILYIANREFIVKTYSGDMWLGGDDLDQEIVQIITKWIKDTYQDVDLDDRRFKMLARQFAEKSKIELTQQAETDIFIPACFTLAGGLLGDVSMRITKAEFEQAIERYVQTAVTLVKQTLHNIDLEPDDITTVLLVGGSTKIPRVRQTLAGLFGEDKIRADIDPMNAVAMGAAILASRLQGVECPKCKKDNSEEAHECQFCKEPLASARSVIRGIGLHEKTDRDFGICVLDQGDPDVFSVIIPAQTPYPLTQPMRQRYAAIGREIIIPVYVGNNAKASLNEYLGLVEYSVPLDVPPGNAVIVEFNYDRNRILKVRVEVEGRSELSYEVMPKRQIADPNKPREEKWRLEMENAVAWGEGILEKNGRFVNPSEKANLEKSLQYARESLNIQDQSVGQKAISSLFDSINRLEVAAHLFMADRLMAYTDAETTGVLAARTKDLRQAYEDHDDIKVQRLKEALDADVRNIVQNLPTRQSTEYNKLLRKIA